MTYNFDLKTIKTLNIAACEIVMTDLTTNEIVEDVNLLHEFFEANEELGASKVLMIIQDLMHKGRVVIEEGMGMPYEIKLTGLIAIDSELWEFDPYA